MAESRLRRWRRVLAVQARLGHYLRPYRWQLGGALGLTLVVAAVELLKPWPLQWVVDQVLLGTARPGLPAWLAAPDTLLLAAFVGAVLLAGVGGVAAYWRDLWLADAGQRAIGKVRRDAMLAVLAQPPAGASPRAGDLLVRLCGDTQSLRILLVDGLCNLGREGLLVVGTLVAMALVDWRLAAVAAGVLPCLLLLLWRAAGRLRRAARQQRAKEGELAAGAHETLAAVGVVQAYGLEGEAVRAFARQNRRSAKAGLAATRIEGRLGAATDVVLALGGGLVLWLGVGRCQAGALTPGELLVLLAYVRSFYRPIRKGLGRSAAMVKAVAAGERVLELLDLPRPVVAPAVPVPLPHCRGEVVFRGVQVATPDGRPVLTGVDLQLAAGEHVALVGGNGAGKTTLASLLPRLREPAAGQVLLDGVDVRQLDPAVLRGHLAMVFQESLLFAGTLRENLQLGRPAASAEAVAAAAAATGLDQLAARWPDGLDTAVGERGATLSGGERQRVALARALLRDAAVLVFDEPTTGLDAGAAADLVARLLPQLRGRTVLLITHDPRLLGAVDRVVELRDGRCRTISPAALAGGVA